MNYMIAYDFSIDAENALNTTIRTMNKSVDHLFIATVSENLGKKYGIFGKVEQMKEAQNHIEQETKDKLNAVLKSAAVQGVRIYVHHYICLFYTRLVIVQVYLLAQITLEKEYVTQQKIKILMS